MSLTKNLEFEKTSFLTKSNSAFLEQMYLKYINKDLDLPSSWKNYFDDLGDELDLVVNEIKGPSWAPIKKQINIVEKKPKKEVHSNGSVRNVISENNLQNNIDSIKAVELIRAYRLRGHLLAKLDPLGLKKN
jgi:2-oxoglutarate dehydrogenase E1 component